MWTSGEHEVDVKGARAQLQVSLNTGRVELSRIWISGEVLKPSQLHDEVIQDQLNPAPYIHLRSS